MKHIVAPRRYGKTTKLVEYVLTLNENVIILSPTQTYGRKVILPLIRKISEDIFEYDENDRKIIFQNGRTIQFFSIDNPELKKHVKTLKVIDEAGLILDRLYGNVQLITSSGPNYDLNDARLTKITESLPEDWAAMEEHKARWDLEETSVKKQDGVG